MNTADEYRLVTGGFSETITRRISPAVWTSRAKMPRAVAALFVGFDQPSQETAARTITPRYSHWQRKNGSNRLRKYSSPVRPTSAGLAAAAYVSRYSRTA